MSRRDRRAALVRGKAGTPADIPALVAEATLAYQQGGWSTRRWFANKFYPRDRARGCSEILGLLLQRSGNRRLAADLELRAYQRAVKSQAPAMRARACKKEKAALIPRGLEGGVGIVGIGYHLHCRLVFLAWRIRA